MFSAAQPKRDNQYYSIRGEYLFIVFNSVLGGCEHFFMGNKYDFLV